MPSKTLIKEIMGYRPFPVFFLFLVLFFFNISGNFLSDFILNIYLFSALISSHLQ